MASSHQIEPRAYPEAEGQLPDPGENEGDSVHGVHSAGGTDHMKVPQKSTASGLREGTGPRNVHKEVVALGASSCHTGSQTPLAKSHSFYSPC